MPSGAHICVQGSDLHSQEHFKIPVTALQDLVFFFLDKLNWVSKAMKLMKMLSPWEHISRCLLEFSLEENVVFAKLSSLCPYFL